MKVLKGDGSGGPLNLSVDTKEYWVWETQTSVVHSVKAEVK